MRSKNSRAYADIIRMYAHKIPPITHTRPLYPHMLKVCGNSMYVWKGPV